MREKINEILEKISKKRYNVDTLNESEITIRIRRREDRLATVAIESTGIESNIELIGMLELAKMTMLEQGIVPQNHPENETE